MGIFAEHRLLRCVVLPVALLCAATWASGTPWFARVWTVDEGLPGDTVSAVLQTDDGYLWLGTQSGLARFDGVRIERIRMPVGEPFPLTFAVLADRGGRFWIAQDSGYLVRMGVDGARRFTREEGLSRTQPMRMAETPDGAVWISYADGVVCRIVGDEVTRFGGTNIPPGSGPCFLAVDAGGQLWYARRYRAGVFRDGRFVSLWRFRESPVQVTGARDGGVWICAGNRVLKARGTNGLVEVGRVESESQVRPNVLFEDRSGLLWIGTTASGLFNFNGTDSEAVATSHGRILSILEDREGNLWVGTEGGGLNRLRRRVVELQGRAQGLPFDTVRSVCEDSTGGIWAAMQDGQLARNDGSGWQTISSTPAWPGGQATCVTADTDGGVWVGTAFHGLYRWRDGEFTRFTRTNGLVELSVRSLLYDRSGNLWIAFGEGTVLQRYRDGAFENFALPSGSRAVRAMCEDAAGQIWMANLDAQLLRVEGNRVVDETGRTELPPRPIRALAATGDGSLWLGYYASGIGRLKQGKFGRVTRAQGLADDGICSLMPDERGWLWVGSDHGIFRARVADLDAVLEGRAPSVRCISHGKDDTLPSLQAYYGYSPGPARTRDGRVLIPTRLGLVIARPELAQTNYVPPRVIIESVTVDDRELLPAVRAELPPSHSKVEFRYTAPSFIDPERIRFWYRLEGFDRQWVEAEGERTAKYPQLRAGRYVFEVRAESHAGLTSERTAEFAFVVAPFVWQRWWFQAAAGGLLVAAVTLVVRLVSVRRLRRKVERLEQENALQRERARIAQDLHDEFGARMTQISLLAERAQHALARPEEATDFVTRIARMSREGIKSLDEIVWAINPRNDTLSDLLDYAGQHATDFLRVAGIRCRLDFPDRPPARPLPASLRYGLFLAVKEALNNIVKHAQASEVWLRVRATDAGLELSIEDNGRGFATAPEDALADGLRNMRERLKRWGGNCLVESRPGAGTRVKFEVPWQFK